jgi:hypothetical protein
MTALPTIPVEHRLRLVETGGAPMSAPSDDGPTGQPTPLLADEAAERRVLASVLFNPDNCLVPVRELVPSPEAFAVPRHAALYRVLLGMADARVPIEWATLESQLRTTTRQGDFEAFSALAIELVDEPNWDAGPARTSPPSSRRSPPDGPRSPRSPTRCGGWPTRRRTTSPWSRRRWTASSATPRRARRVGGGARRRNCVRTC